MAMPTLGVAVDFANGPAFGNPLILGDASTPLGTGILADTPSDVVDVSNITLRASIRRGRNRILNKFEAGSATIVLEDQNGDWVPSNPASPYYGKLLPLRKIRIWADYNSVRYYLYSGYITSYDTNFSVGFNDLSTVTLQCVDAFRLFSNVSISTVAGTSAGQTTGSSLEWLPINRWRADPMANIATFNTTNTVNIYENIQPGRTVQVYYTTTPTTLDNNTDDYADVTGLPESSVEVVILGACYKLLSYVDSGRINLSSAEADLNDTKIPSTAGVASSRYIYALYQQRLNDEALKLQDKYPIRIHYTK